MSDKTEYVGSTNALSMPYFKLHRDVTQTFVDRDMSAVSQRIYLYICHNSLVHQGISFKLDIPDIADWVGKSVRTVYRALAEIEQAGLGSIRDTGHVIFDLPYMIAAKQDAKEYAINAKEQKADEKLESEVAIALEAFQGALGRDLTESERKSFIRRFLAKKSLS